MGGILAKLQKSETIYCIAELKTKLESQFDPRTNTIEWNSRAAMLTTNCSELSATTVLNHEADHALRHDKDPKGMAADQKNKPTSGDYKNREEERVITGSEQKTAKALGEIEKGEVTRTDHEGTMYRAVSSTSVEWKDEKACVAKRIKN